jgi:outer membrane protein assembly factor BamE (lipoprotein component of BamABCDE complex)
MGKMFTRAFFACLIGGPLASCGTIPDLRQNLVGVSEEKVASCMGEPARKETAGRTEVWTYYAPDNVVSSASPYASSSLPLRGSTARGNDAPEACIVTVKLQATRVMDVNYQNVVTHDDASCAQALERCQIN